MKEALKSAFWYGKENGVLIPESWIMNKCAGNVAQDPEET